MSRLESVAVIGLGMIGGSVARGLASSGIRILGYDSNASHLDAAIDEGVVATRLSPGLEGVRDADAVVIAVHGDAAGGVLDLLRSATDVGVITDVGSTKEAVLAGASRRGMGARFVGSHPFAGDHRSGWNASRGDLFVDERVYICAASEVLPSALETAAALWTSLGSRPVVIDARSHDRLMAWASHLPHMVSTALALTLLDRGIERHELGRGGRDVARLAGGSPEMWTAIASENSAELDSALAGIEHQLRNMRAALQSGDPDVISAMLARARDWSANDDGNPDSATKLGRATFHQSSVTSAPIGVIGISRCSNHCSSNGDS